MEKEEMLLPNQRDFKESESGIPLVVETGFFN